MSSLEVENPAKRARLGPRLGEDGDVDESKADGLGVSSEPDAGASTTIIAQFATLEVRMRPRLCGHDAP